MRLALPQHTERFETEDEEGRTFWANDVDLVARQYEWEAWGLENSRLVRADAGVSDKYSVSGDVRRGDRRRLCRGAPPTDVVSILTCKASAVLSRSASEALTEEAAKHYCSAAFIAGFDLRDRRWDVPASGGFRPRGRWFPGRLHVHS